MCTYNGFGPFQEYSALEKPESKIFPIRLLLYDFFIYKINIVNPFHGLEKRFRGISAQAVLLEQ